MPTPAVRNRIEAQLTERCPCGDPDLEVGVEKGAGSIVCKNCDHRVGPARSAAYDGMLVNYAPAKSRWLVAAELNRCRTPTESGL